MNELHGELFIFGPMRRRFYICIYTILILVPPFPFSGQCQDPVGPPAGSILKPVQIPVFLSGNFAEPRANHFHSGIDIKTNGLTGIPVISVSDGHISRIKVEPGGFGKALYIVHPNGFTSVYAHLLKFSEEVDRFVKSEQYRRESFTVDLFPESGLFPVKKGQVVALSGNTGSSEGPHLHFELRETHSENPVNPLIRSIEVKDNTLPVVERLYIFSQSGNKFLKEPLAIALQGSKGNYLPAGNQVVPLDDVSGIGLAVYDLIDGSANRCGIYRIQAFLDDNMFFETVLDEFSFAETRYMNSFIDYRLFVRDRRPVIKLFIDPNNRASVYRYTKNNGIISLRDDREQHLRLVIQDAAGNTSTVNCRCKRNPSAFQSNSDSLTPYEAFFNYAESNDYVDEEIRISIPPGALYDNLYFRYEQKPAPPGCYSRLHQVHRNDVPLHQFYRLAILSDDLPPALKSKAVIAQSLENGKFSTAGGTWEGNWLVARTRNFGTFCILTDTIPPGIRPSNFTSAAELKTLKSIRFVVQDNLSGIKSYRGEIDGKWALFEYDPKNNLLEYVFDNERLLSGSQQKLVLTVTDQRNNTRNYSIAFSR